MMSPAATIFAESALWPVVWFYAFLLMWAMLHVFAGHHHITREALDRLGSKIRPGRPLGEIAAESAFFSLVRQDLMVSRWMVLLLCLQASLLYLTVHLELSYNQAWVEALLLSMALSPATQHFTWNFARPTLAARIRHWKDTGSFASPSTEKDTWRGASNGETIRIDLGKWFSHEWMKSILPQSAWCELSTDYLHENHAQSESHQTRDLVDAPDPVQHHVPAPAPDSTTVRRKEIVHIDAAVLPLVEALNECGCYRTYSSCEGHGKGRPFVLFQSEMADAARLESAIRMAWPDGHLHVEWMVKMIFDNFCRLRFELSPVVWTIDLPCTTPSRREVTEDLLALSQLVQSLRMDARGDQEKETHADQNQQPTDQHSDFSHTQLPFLFANGPRTVGPAFRTGYRITRYFFPAYRAKDTLGHFPYSLWTAIRTNDCITLSRWCQCLDAMDPMKLREDPAKGNPQCLAYRGCGGWPLLSSEGKSWFMFAGTEAYFSRLAWVVRSLVKRATKCPSVEGFFDLSMRPVVVVWGEKRPCTDKDGNHSAIMSIFAEAIRQSFTGKTNHADPFI